MYVLIGIAIFSIWFVLRFGRPEVPNEFDEMDKMWSETKHYQLRERKGQ